MCPYLPFSARVCLNQHHWLANRLREKDINFGKTSNAFLKCSNFARLQELADSLSARDLLTCSRKWLAAFRPFFKEQERKQAGCQHRLFFAQVEYCDDLIFRRRAALDALGERLLDANRTIGQPDKITLIFGRKITSRHRGKLQTEIEDMHLPNPVIRSHYANGGKLEDFHVAAIGFKSVIGFPLFVIRGVVLNQVDPVAASIEGGYRHLLQEGQISLPLNIVLLMQVDELGIVQLHGPENLLRIALASRGDLR